MLSDQDTGFENKARVRKLPLQVFTAPDAQKLETEKQNKKETEASLNADNDTYNGLECSQEQIELGLREKEKILEEARKEAAAIEQEAKEKAEQLPAQIPQLKKLEVRLNSPSADPTNYEFALICDFETMDDLNTYQVHPAHVAFGQFIKPLREARACIDYEY